MGRNRRSTGKNKAKKTAKLVKTKRISKAEDQLYEDNLPHNRPHTIAKATQFDEDRPGLGQFYCAACGRYFISDTAMQTHGKTKAHKRRYIHNHN